MTINSAELSYFQSHQKTVLELHESVNAIIGISDSGKSAIKRAIKWNVENRPSGEEFKSDFAPDEETRVSLFVETEVRRGRSKDSNYYWMDGIRYEAFGQDVPQPIKDKLNLGSLNIQNQFDPPFLLSESPGAVARYLNQVVDLDDIDESIKNVNTLLKKTEGQLSNNKERLEKLDSEILTYPDFNKLDKLIIEAEKLNKTLQENKYTSQLLLQTISEIKESQKILDSIIIPKIDIGEIEFLLKSYEEKSDVVNKLEFTINKVNESEKIIKLINIPNINVLELEKIIDEYEFLNQKIKGFQSLIRTIDNIEKTILETGKEIIEWGKKLKEQMGDRCKLCGQSVSQHSPSSESAHGVARRKKKVTNG
jgi:predicted transcriptional regulator